MFTDTINFYNETANMIRFLKDKTGLFNRLLDVFIVGGVVGMLFKMKGTEKVDKNKATIFPKELSGESVRIKYLSSLAYLIENNHNETSEYELLKQTFSDWFASNNNKESVEYEKYKLFKQYSIGGIEILYNNIVSEAANKESYLKNFRKFIKKLEDEDIIDDFDRAILGGLVG